MTSAGYNVYPDSGPSNVVTCCIGYKCSFPYLPSVPDIALSVGSVPG